MSAHTPCRSEAFATNLAVKRSLVRMSPVVHSQNVQRVEPLPTSLTFVLPLVRVIDEMPPILRDNVERFPANLASLSRRRVVNSFMYNQTAFELELLVANVAGVRLTIRVHVQVADQVPRMFPAHFANFPVVVPKFALFLSFPHDLWCFRFDGGFSIGRQVRYVWDYFEMVVVIVNVVVVVVFLVFYVSKIFIFVIFFDLVYLNFYLIRCIITSEVLIDVLTSQSELERVL